MRLLLSALFALGMTALPAAAADIKNLDLGKETQVWFAEDHTRTHRGAGGGAAVRLRL